MFHKKLKINVSTNCTSYSVTVFMNFTFQNINLLIFNYSALPGDGAEEARIGEETGFTLHTVDKDGKECADPNDPITAELVSHGDGAAVKCQVARKEDNTYELKYQPQSRGQHDLHVKVYGRPIKNSPFTVAVRKATPDCQGTHAKSITGLNTPRSQL